MIHPFSPSQKCIILYLQSISGTGTTFFVCGLRDPPCKNISVLYLSSQATKVYSKHQVRSSFSLSVSHASQPGPAAVSQCKGVIALVSCYFWERWLDEQSSTWGYISFPREGDKVGKSGPLSLEVTQSCSQFLLFAQDHQDALGARGAALWQAYS